MSEQNDTAQASAKAPKIYATLVHGATYYLKTKLFTKGKAVEVTAEERAKLEERAVDPVDITVGEEITSEFRQKFTFSSKADEEEKAKPVRRRPAA